jgi:hypothetical protein
LAGTPSTKGEKPVAKSGNGSTTGSRKGVGSEEIGPKIQKRVKAAAGGEISAGQECGPGAKAATGGLRAAGLECPPLEKAATGGDNTAGKECLHEEKASAGRQKGAGQECPSNSDGREEADLEGLYSVRGKGKIVGPELAPEYLAAAAGAPVVMKGAEQFGTKGKEQPLSGETSRSGQDWRRSSERVELLKEFREDFAWSIHDLSNTSIEGVEFEVSFTWTTRSSGLPAGNNLQRSMGS